MVVKRASKRFTYGEDFEAELETFEKNIMIDTRLDNLLKDPKRRFSAAIRNIIMAYNVKFKQLFLTDKVESKS